VIDSSLFPTNLGVNPQLAIMGIAMHAARQIARPERS
jgi:choline dehydrogenase-like flavoprotein